MNDYEYLIAEHATQHGVYRYGQLDNLSSHGLFFCIFVEETCETLDVKDIAAVIAVLIGQPWLSTRGKFGGATKGTSIASRISRTLLDYDFKRAILPTLTNQSLTSLRLRMVNNLGVFVGRWVPFTGWSITAFDVARITITSIAHYNRLAEPEDQINDATTGSFG
jgi:hypothetical protein